MSLEQRRRQGKMCSTETSRAASLESSRFTLTRVSSFEQLEVATQLRERAFSERRGIHFDEKLEAGRDREGHVFMLFDGATPVAVGRVLPYPSRLSSLVDLSRVAGAYGADSEVGRVASVASSRLPQSALLLLTLGSQWLLEHTRLRHYVGYCHPGLLASYAKLGAVPGPTIRVPDRREPYCIISGTYQDAASLGLRRFGSST